MKGMNVLPYPSTVAGGLGIAVQIGQQSRGIYTLKVYAGLKEKYDLLRTLIMSQFHLNNASSQDKLNHFISCLYIPPPFK